MHHTPLTVAIRLFVTLTIVTGAIYPAVITLAGRMVFPWQASGSIVQSGQHRIGSALIAQPPWDSRHFSSRPSAGNYATIPSAASNLAVTSAVLRDSIRARAGFWNNRVGDIPSDLLFSSGSGLDPHISPQAAMVQADLIRRSRGFSAARAGELHELIARRTERPQFGVLGESRVNVLLLNCDLDGLPITRGK